MAGSSGSRSTAGAGAQVDVAGLVVPIGCVALIWHAPGILLGIIPGAVVAVLLERLVPFREQRVLRTGWRTDLYHAVVTWTIAPVGSILVVTLVTAGVGAVLAGALASVRSQPTPLRVVEAIVVSDLGAYWFHRACHKAPLLWRFHRIHHIGEDLDWLSRYRIHPVDVSILGIFEFLPFFLLGVPPAITAAYFLVVAYDGTLSHSNIRLRLGPAWWIIKNPEFHRWHHSRDRKPGNSNFCELLPIWDVFFGTTYMPRDRKPAALGVPGNKPVDFIDQLVAPVQRQRTEAA